LQLHTGEPFPMIHSAMSTGFSKADLTDNLVSNHDGTFPQASSLPDATELRKGELQTQADDISQLTRNFEFEDDVIASVYDSCGKDLAKAVEMLSEMTESMGIEKYYVLKTIDEGQELFPRNNSFQK
jgi:hypothetical protein